MSTMLSLDTRETESKLPDKADFEHRLLYSTTHQRGSWKLLRQVKNLQSWVMKPFVVPTKLRTACKTARLEVDDSGISNESIG
jgi:hypothetical protein